MSAQSGKRESWSSRLGIILARLRREIRISLDYYERKFPGKNIGKIFFITSPDYQTDLEGFVKESGLTAQFIDINSYIKSPVAFSLTFIKAYASALSKINTALKINLLAAKERTEKKVSVEQVPLNPLLAFFKANAVVMMGSFLMCAAVVIMGVSRISPLKKELEKVINMRPAVSGVSTGLGYGELTALASNYKNKINAMDNLVKKRLYVTPLLDALPRLLPKAVRLESLSFKKKGERPELTLEGRASSGTSDEGIELANSFLLRLKQDSIFAKYFKEISIISTERGTDSVTFTISCRGDERGTR